LGFSVFGDTHLCSWQVGSRLSRCIERQGLSFAFGVVLTAMGLFLRRVVVGQAFPRELKVPNTETLAAMAESRAAE
jgi:antitoxin component of RelBE/YafQ-DinJ toxin-antitoxin module